MALSLEEAMLQFLSRFTVLGNREQAHCFPATGPKTGVIRLSKDRTAADYAVGAVAGQRW